MNHYLGLLSWRKIERGISMGLDMYLYVRKYESKTQWNENKNVSIKDFYPKELHYLASKHYKDNFLSKTTEYQVGYWRKANAIHKWFVDNCGYGKDNCERYYVSRNALKQLLKLCNQVINNKDQAEQLLPTQKGFFFGDTKYDEWYFEDVEYTIALVKRVINFLEKNKEYDCIYNASW